MPEPADRVVALDLIRGIAVLGILAVNVAGFAGPAAATLTPHIPDHGSALDEATFAAVFVLFEGKMRALFTLLFGASLVLFIDSAEARGREGEVLQLRRLTWLMLFGLLHYFLFWWGDILFLYGLAGIAVLFLRQIPARPLVTGALLAFLGWHLAGALENLGALRAEENVRLGIASAAEARDQADFLATFTSRAMKELAEFRLGFFEQIGIKLGERPLRPIENAWPSLGETIPLMLIGAVLHASGFYAGAWSRRRLWLLAGLGLTLGLAMTLPMLDWLWQRGFPPQAMTQAMLYWTAPAHLLMGLAYAALLVLGAPRLATTWLGRRLIAAGRMAFTNYIACTVLMTAIFYGWGFGLVGTLGHAQQLILVLLAWALMLAWSAPWLNYFRQGPLEWLWRSLTERRVLPLRRASALQMH